MAVNTQFSIAVHVMAGLAHRREQPTTSSQLASSVNTSASFVRRVLAKLSKAGLVRTTTGQSGSCVIGREPAKISLLDIYRAVDAPKAFSIHTYPEQDRCMISCNIKASLEKVLDQTQKAMEASLKKLTIADVLGEMSAK